MPVDRLGELDKSKLLNELELLPSAEKQRIDRATGAGRPLDDPHERDMQRARVAQMPWVRAVGAVIFPLIALSHWSAITDGRRNSWLDWLGAAAFTAMAVFYVRRWWLMRRLGRTLDVSQESPPESPERE